MSFPTLLLFPCWPTAQLHWTVLGVVLFYANHIPCPAFRSLYQHDGFQVQSSSDSAILFISASYMQKMTCELKTLCYVFVVVHVRDTLSFEHCFDVVCEGAIFQCCVSLSLAYKKWLKATLRILRCLQDSRIASLATCHCGYHTLYIFFFKCSSLVLFTGEQSNSLWTSQLKVESSGTCTHCSLTLKTWIYFLRSSYLAKNIEQSIAKTKSLESAEVLVLHVCSIMVSLETTHPSLSLWTLKTNCFEDHILFDIMSSDVAKKYVHSFCGCSCEIQTKSKVVSRNILESFHFFQEMTSCIKCKLRVHPKSRIRWQWKKIKRIVFACRELCRPSFK